MKIKDIEPVTGRRLVNLKGNTELLLARINYNHTPKYVLFNTRESIAFGHNGDSVYKGITEEDDIVNVSAAAYCYRTGGRILSPGILTIFPYYSCDDEDKKFLDDKRRKIENLAMKKKTRRILLELS